MQVRVFSLSNGQPKLDERQDVCNELLKADFSFFLSEKNIIRYHKRFPFVRKVFWIDWALRGQGTFFFFFFTSNKSAA